jgi:hypothetical protein
MNNCVVYHWVIWEAAQYAVPFIKSAAFKSVVKLVTTELRFGESNADKQEQNKNQN